MEINIKLANSGFWKKFFLLQNFLVVVSFALAIVAHVLAVEYSEDKDQAKVAFRGKAVESLIEKSFHQNLEVVYSIQSFFVTSLDFTRAQFKDFVANSLSRHSGIQAIEHMIRIEDRDRTQYEKQMQSEGFLHFVIKELGPDGKLRKAEKRDYYQVINYVEPLQENMAALGYDISFTPAAKETMLIAETEGLGVSPWLVLAQGELGFVVYLTIPKTHGIAAGVFRLKKFIETAIEASQSDGVDFIIEEVTHLQNQSQKKMFFDSINNKLESLTNQKISFNKAVSSQSIMTVGQRSWHLTFFPSKQFKSVIHPTIPYLVSLTVLLLMLSVTFLFIERDARVTAETATKVREEFMTVASHELRTPLTPLKMEIFLVKELIQSGKSTEEKIISLLDNANKHLNHIVSLIDDLLDVGQIGEERYQYHFTHFNIDSLMRETVEKFSPVFKANGCSVQMSLQPEVKVFWDAQRIEQVIANCLSNSVKFSSQAIIEINVRADGPDVIFSIKDNGIGISEEFQKKIFNKFERGVSSKSYGGLGLGLYIVLQIIKAHAGTVRVNSQPGAGAEFVFKVPRNV